MKEAKSANLLWLDLETTGLDPNIHDILEIGAVVTNADLVEIPGAQFQCVITQPELSLVGIDPFVINMHLENGLFEECADANRSVPLAHAQHLLTSFAVAHRCFDCFDAEGKAYRTPLCGSTPSFDRGFLRVEMPGFERKLSHHHVDASSFKELARRAGLAAWLPREDAFPGRKHRALPDLYYSLAVCRIERELLQRGAFA